MICSSTMLLNHVPKHGKPILSTANLPRFSGDAGVGFDVKYGYIKGNFTLHIVQTWGYRGGGLKALVTVTAGVEEVRSEEFLFTSYARPWTAELPGHWLESGQQSQTKLRVKVQWSLAGSQASAASPRPSGGGPVTPYQQRLGGPAQRPPYQPETSPSPRAAFRAKMAPQQPLAACQPRFSPYSKPANAPAKPGGRIPERLTVFAGAQKLGVDGAKFVKASPVLAQLAHASPQGVVFEKDIPPRAIKGLVKFVEEEELDLLSDPVVFLDLAKKLKLYRLEAAVEAAVRGELAAAAGPDLENLLLRFAPLTLHNHRVKATLVETVRSGRVAATAALLGKLRRKTPNFAADLARLSANSR